MQNTMTQKKTKTEVWNRQRSMLQTSNSKTTANTIINIKRIHELGLRKLSTISSNFSDMIIPRYHLKFSLRLRQIQHQAPAH